MKIRVSCILFLFIMLALPAFVYCQEADTTQEPNISAGEEEDTAETPQETPSEEETNPAETPDGENPADGEENLSDKIKNPFGRNFMITTGAIMLNPFTIEKNEDGNYEIKGESESEAKFYVEMIARHRPAFFGEAKNPNSILKHFIPTDLEGRMGFVTSSDDISGSTIAGSGECFLDLSLGWCVYSACSSTSFNVEGFFSLVTDREFQDIHDLSQFGL